MYRFEAEDESGITTEYQTYGGLTYRTVTAERIFAAHDLKLQMEWIQEMKIRPSDVILCAYPKAGTHWLWEIITMLQKGTAEYEVNAKETAMLEFCTKEMVDKIPFPRVLNTHNFHHLLPEAVKEKRCKIIHLQRNPKDVITSMFYHFRNFPILIGDLETTFPQLVKTFIGKIGKPFPCSWFTYVKSYEEFGKDNPGYPFLNMYFEDLKTNPVKETRKLANFLEVDASDKLVADIAEKCEFQRLKTANMEVKDDPTRNKAADGNSPMFRKGIIGDWKSHFSVADNEEFDIIYEEEMVNSSLKFQFE